MYEREDGWVRMAGWVGVGKWDVDGWWDVIIIGERGEVQLRWQCALTKKIHRQQSTNGWLAD